MKFWIDTEFIEDGKTIDLISIGVAAEDGRTYYAEAEECDLSKASPWVVENVFPGLTGVKTPRAQIAADLIEFCGEKPEIWGYYADYDWVVLCQLFGRMIDLPKGWPMYCRDLKQLCDEKGGLKLPKQDGGEHNALADAIWTKQSWFYAALSNPIARKYPEQPRTETPAARDVLAERRVRHVKRGTTYRVIGEAEAQVSTGTAEAWVLATDVPDAPEIVRYSRLIGDGDLLTVYKTEAGGKLWVRFTDEFEDGRFAEIERIDRKGGA